MFSKVTEKGVISDSSSPNIVTNCNINEAGIIDRHPGWHTQEIVHMHTDDLLLFGRAQAREDMSLTIKICC